MTCGNCNIHKTSIVESGAKISNSANIGPYCCIGANVIIEDNVRLMSHVVIDGRTRIGHGVSIFPFSSIGLIPQDLKYKNEESRLEIGENTVIRECVTIHLGTETGGMLTKIGRNCLIMAYCHVAHDCLIGDHVVLTNGVNLSGHVHVDDYAIIGGMCPVKQFIRIGKHAMIGGFSGVDRDIPPYCVAKGTMPISSIGINIIGLKRRNFPPDDILEASAAHKELFNNSEMTMFERIRSVERRFSHNKIVMDIINFLKEKSRNPICQIVAMLLVCYMRIY